MHRDQVLDKLLQLIAVHLKESLRDGQPQLDLLGFPYAVEGESHHVGAIEDVLVAAATRYRCDFAAVEADADVAQEFGLRRRGGLPHGAAEVEAWVRAEEMVCHENKLHCNFLPLETVGLGDMAAQWLALTPRSEKVKCKKFACSL